MTPPAPLAKGSILKVRFPWDSHPKVPGPFPHYCLLASVEEFEGQTFVAVAYGTSRMDRDLERSHSGLVFDVPSTYIRGDEMPGAITHFVCDMVALLPFNDEWVYRNWKARLAFMRESERTEDRRAARYYDQFQSFELTLRKATFEALDDMLTSGSPGLPHGKKLRHAR